MGDTQTTKAAETVRVKQKTEDRPPHERESAPSAFAEAKLFRAAASDDPTTPPQHMARVLRRLAAPHQKTGFLRQCQRRYGNAYVQRMISSRDNEHSSPLKQEAHTQEEPIVRQITAPDVATAYAEEASSLGGPENIAVQTEPQAVLITPNVQRQKGKDDEEDNPILTKSAGSMADSFEAGADVETQVSLSQGRGSPLPEPVRAYMEPRFGVDFNQVRVHTGSNAIHMNQAVGAQAFTVGRDIYYGAGKEPTDLSLTAHELTHVLQQEGDQPQRARRQAKREAAKDDASSKRGKVRLNVLSTSLQRQDTPPDHLASLNEMLDSFDIPEEEVISLLRELTPTEKSTVTTDLSYKTRMASAFDTGEMVQAVGILNLSLDKQLEWIEAATSTSSIDYSEIRTLVTSAPQSARDTLKTSTWRDFFVGVCDNSTIIIAVTDLDYDLQTQLEWIGEEASTSNIEYSQIQPLVTGAPQTERDALKTNTWRDFFVGVCDNSTIITAVTDLDYDLQTQLEWIGEEASTSNIEYSQIQSLVTGAPQTERDALKTNTWRDFFVGVCDNSTIITAVTDLDYDLQTQLEWIGEEASTSNIEYSQIQPLVTGAPQTERDALKTNTWRDFFVGVCNKATMEQALVDLNYDMETQVRWMIAESDASTVLASTTFMARVRADPNYVELLRILSVDLGQHAGAAIPDAATQALINSELFPARGAPGAPPLDWDGAITAGMTPPQIAAANAARAALKTEMTTALNANLTAVMPEITATAGQRRLPITSLESAGQAAKADVDAQFGAYATAAALTVPQETARRVFTISASGGTKNLFDAQDPADRTAVGMGIDPTDLASWMAETVPGCVIARNTHHLDPVRSVEERDFLRTEIIDLFVAANTPALEAFDLHGFAMSNPDTGQIVLPTSVPLGLSDVAPGHGGPSDAERGSKWSSWRTMVHEYIHQLEHPAVRGWPARNRTISEGFCEYFTKKVLLPLLPSAAGTDVGRRTLIEGADNGVPSPAIIGGAYNPGSYADYLARVEAIEGHLGGAAVGAQNAMKAIFFQGHLEYLGFDPAGNPLTAPAGPQDMITVPAAITTFGALATATNVTEPELRSANPGAAEPLSGRMRAPGVREHRVVIAGPSGSGARGETLAIIATQHNVTQAALSAANPGVNFATLGEGDIVIIPRHY